MFVQVILGHANDKPGLRPQPQRWEPDTEPRHPGPSAPPLASPTTALSPSSESHRKKPHTVTRPPTNGHLITRTRRSLDDGIEFQDCRQADQ